MIVNEILRTIVPTEIDRRRIKRISDVVLARLRDLVEEEGVDAELRLEGSVAKDTWLRDEADVDIFVRLSQKYDREFLATECLRLARKAE